MRFEVRHTSGHARSGVLETAHGVVETPAFMPVATQATVKAVSASEVAATGTRLVIMNTYHLMLRPGAEIVRAHGGLHEFSRIFHAIATDSGGYQAFSLAERVKLSEDGFEFASHLDGSRIRLSPEESLRIQALLGADLVMQLDVCPPAGASRVELVDAVERTTRWAERSLRAKDSTQALFGIVQGGTDIELRLAHAERMATLPFDGIALGGFSVGEPPGAMHAALAAVGPRLDAARPRYLMGVGTPTDLVLAMAAGIDLFDCVLPTRNARNGQAFVSDGRIVIKRARYREDREVLERGCACPACGAGYSRSYLRHLYLADEILAHRLLSLHNLFFYARLVAGARFAIARGEYALWAEARLLELGAADVADGTPRQW